MLSINILVNLSTINWGVQVGVQQVSSETWNGDGQNEIYESNRVTKLTITDSSTNGYRSYNTLQMKSTNYW